MLSYINYVCIYSDRCLVKKLMQFEVNSIECCILKIQYSKQIFVHLRSELCLIEFDI